MGTETIHASEMIRQMQKAQRAKTEDVYTISVATLGSISIVTYQGYIVGKAPMQRFRIKLKDSGAIRTFAACLVVEFEGKEVYW